jgi:hypothetical protein
MVTSDVFNWVLCKLKGGCRAYNKMSKSEASVCRYTIPLPVSHLLVYFCPSSVAGLRVYHCFEHRCQNAQFTFGKKTNRWTTSVFTLSCKIFSELWSIQPHKRKNKSVDRIVYQWHLLLPNSSFCCCSAVHRSTNAETLLPKRRIINYTRPENIPARTERKCFFCVFQVLFTALKGNTWDCKWNTAGDYGFLVPGCQFLPKPVDLYAYRRVHKRFFEKCFSWAKKNTIRQ